ncbi:YrrC family ATP-dependent DNA helicase [Streptomyces mirabilis]|uniref:YrrC family ATP-dependent DNA helicase n=1 Tax=Streptomyces mirabilis TaxID=68239 RepID=UPI003FA21D15
MTGGDEESVTAVGKALFGVRPGESLRLHGAWTCHPRHGRQPPPRELTRVRVTPCAARTRAGVGHMCAAPALIASRMRL